MRFYTGKLEGTQLLFAGFEKDPFLYKNRRLWNEIF